MAFCILLSNSYDNYKSLLMPIIKTLQTDEEVKNLNRKAKEAKNSTLALSCRR